MKPTDLNQPIDRDHIVSKSNTIIPDDIVQYWSLNANKLNQNQALKIKPSGRILQKPRENEKSLFENQKENYSSFKKKFSWYNTFTSGVQGTFQKAMDSLSSQSMHRQGRTKVDALKRSNSKVLGSLGPHLRMNVFGVDVEDILIRERLLLNIDSAYRLVPQIVDQCLNYLIPAYQSEQGLFRISGTAKDVQNLKDDYNNGNITTLSQNPNCHAVTSLLKLYFRELPSPLYPVHMHSKLIKASRISVIEERRAQLSQLISKLPYSHIAILKRLAQSLQYLLRYSDKNKMTAESLAIVWWPNLMWNKRCEKAPSTYKAFSKGATNVIQSMINEAEFIFGTQQGWTNCTRKCRRSIFALQTSLSKTFKVEDHENIMPNNDSIARGNSKMTIFNFNSNPSCPASKIRDESSLIEHASDVHQLSSEWHISQVKERELLMDCIHRKSSKRLPIHSSYSTESKLLKRMI